MSSCSSTSCIQYEVTNTSSSSLILKKLPMSESIQKRLPEMDQFAKRRKNKDQIDRELSEASCAISTAVKAISSHFSDEKRGTSGYMSAIEVLRPELSISG